jgi:catechol 2,3-dioxygenase-like lactoylglutathione lyase family enzyme
VIWRLASWQISFLNRFTSEAPTSGIVDSSNSTDDDPVLFAEPADVRAGRTGNMKNGVRFNHVGPQFAVENVEQAVGFYAAALGFKLDYLDGEPPRYAVVFSDEVYTHLSQPQPPDFVSGGGRAFVAVSGVDRIWDRARVEAPDSIVQPLQDLDYGHEVRFRVFTLSDPAGNTIRIGEPLTSNLDGDR